MTLETPDYGKSVRIINGFANRVQRRLASLPQGVMSLDDIKQELWVAWCKAAESFDADRGIPFEPYLRRGMQRHINQIIHTNIEKFPEQTFASSLDKPIGEDEGGSLSDIVADDKPPAIEMLEREGAWEEAVAVLTPRARQFITLVRDQPDELLQETLLSDHKEEVARELNVPYSNVRRVTSSMVFDLMGASRGERAKISKEIKEVGRRIHG